MDNLQTYNAQLPETIPDLHKFVLIGREKIVAVRAEIRAIDKIGLARGVYLQKLQEAQDLADAVIDAEVRLGELLSELPTSQGQRSDIEQPLPSAGNKSKKQILTEAGLSSSQANRFEQLASAPDIIAEMKAQARQKGDIISRTSVLQAIDHAKRPYIANNTGTEDWYTPDYIIRSAREVMDTIDLDPCSTATANQVVQATQFYTKEQDGLNQEWRGRIWLNPPYNKVGAFVDKLCKSRSDINEAIVLVNNATETQWCRSLMSIASAIVFLEGRTAFVRSDGTGGGKPMQGQMCAYVGSNTARFIRVFGKFGWAAKTVRDKNKK